MKDSYLTTPGFRRRAAELLREMQDARGPLAPSIATDAALLIVDMQEYFLEPCSHAYVPAGPEALERMRTLVDAFAQRGRPIFFTRHLNTPENAGMLGQWWADLITRDDPLSEITPRLDTSRGRVIEKSQYDAFYGTSLEEELRERGARRIVVCGVLTHLCCETTARSAFVRGFEVILPVDASATYNAEFHLATLRNLSHGFATILFTADLLAALQRGRASTEGRP